MTILINGKPAAVVPRTAREMKPPHGAPCNSCGLCCMATLCPLAQSLFRFKYGRCPALERVPQGWTCGVVKDPARWNLGRTLLNGVGAMRAAALHLIGAGDGCDARFDGEPINAAFHRHCEELAKSQRDKTGNARRLWGL